VTGPLLRPGYVLAFDMVFVPRPPVSLELLGISTSLPRSVPTGLFVALLSRAVSGQVVQKLALVAIVGLAAYSMARLVPSERRGARLAAGVLYAWNPLTYERLLLGQWAFLLGYAMLPWVVGAALAVRRGEPVALPRLVLWMAAVTVAGPYAGVFAALLALAVAWAPPADRLRDPPNGSPRPAPSAARLALLVGGAGLLVSLPWLVPTLLHPAVPQDPGLAQTLFRSRADSPVGTLGSLVSLGGLWRTDLAPPGRSTLAWIPAAAIILGLAVAGWRRLSGRWPRGAVAGLLGAAGLGLALAMAPHVPGLDAATRWAATHLPGGGFLRDSQKFVVPVAIAEAMGFGMGVDLVLARTTRRGWTIAASILLAALPIALAPTFAWGAAGRLGEPVSYPRSWAAVARITSDDPTPGAILVLPWHRYLPFEWNGGRTVLDPALVSFERPVVGNTSLEVGGEALPAEDAWSRRADPAVASGRPLAPDLAPLGVRYVLLWKTADWRESLPRVADLAAVLDTPDLTLYRAPPPPSEPRFALPPLAPVVAGDLVTLGVVLAAAVWLARSRRRPGRTKR